MADSQNNGSKIGPPKKEMSMEMRLLLALLLTVPIMFLGPYFLGSQQPEQPAKKTAAPKGPSNPAAQTSSTAPAPPPAASQPPVAAAGHGTPQDALPPVPIDTDLYHIVFTNHGATVSTWQLKKYRGNDNKLLDLVNTAGGWIAPFSMDIPSDKALEQRLNWTYFAQQPDADGLGVSFTYSDGHVAVKKTFRFEKNSYLSTVTSELTEDGRPVAQGLQWRCGFGDLTVPNASSNLHAVYYDNNGSGFLGLTQGKLEEKGAGKETIQASGQHSFAGVSDTYFAAVFLPMNGAPMHETVFTDYTNTAAEAKKLPYPGIAVSDGNANQFRFYVGPKDYDLLKRIDPRLEQLVNFGWIAVLAKPLFLIVNWTNDNIVHSFGWSIIVCTIVLNVVLFPLRISSMKSMRKMQALKPQIDEINAKYKGMSMRDPRKSEQTQETMGLYKKHGVNPTGGCLPMLLQFPIVIAFYYVFRVAIEMRGASWLWVSDLSQPETLPIRILPVVLIATQFLTQKMMPQPGADANAQRMNKFMPLIFGFMFYNFQSGLVLYYLTSNLVSSGLQWFFNKTDTARLAEQSVLPAPKKKPGKR
ncbi:MAG TPA: membrane protein insertase YidC [Bryobacteraceae bacterium]|jgi:YidC/Oxa1 family membrane protein insertase|nr:membrane protein insertase YidC [Bryobacteraceae bacterium]